jgi:hypothetical protein
MAVQEAAAVSAEIPPVRASAGLSAIAWTNEDRPQSKTNTAMIQTIDW